MLQYAAFHFPSNSNKGNYALQPGTIRVASKAAKQYICNLFASPLQRLSIPAHVNNEQPFLAKWTASTTQAPVGEERHAQNTSVQHTHVFWAHVWSYIPTLDLEWQLLWYGMVCIGPLHLHVRSMIAATKIQTKRQQMVQNLLDGFNKTEYRRTHMHVDLPCDTLHAHQTLRAYFVFYLSLMSPPLNWQSTSCSPIAACRKHGINAKSIALGPWAPDTRIKPDLSSTNASQ